MVSGCCPPLALPRRSLGGEIIGFDEKTGQFVPASAGVGASRIVEYPYYAKAGVGGIRDVMATTLGLSLLLSAVFVVGFVVGMHYQYETGETA